MALWLKKKIESQLLEAENYIVLGILSTAVAPIRLTDFFLVGLAAWINANAQSQTDDHRQRAFVTQCEIVICMCSRSSLQNHERKSRAIVDARLKILRRYIVLFRNSGSLRRWITIFCSFRCSAVISSWSIEFIVGEGWRELLLLFSSDADNWFQFRKTEFFSRMSLLAEVDRVEPLTVNTLKSVSCRSNQPKSFPDLHDW